MCARRFAGVTPSLGRSLAESLCVHIEQRETKEFRNAVLDNENKKKQVEIKIRMHEFKKTGP